MADAARVLLHAPALRSVRLDWDDPSVNCKARRALLSTLHRGRAAVRRQLALPVPNISLNLDDLVPKSVARLEAATLELLWRSRGHVRKLELCVMHQAGSAGGRGLYAVMAELQRLESLDVTMTMDFAYSGELRSAALPWLRRLMVNRFYWRRDAENHAKQALVADVVRAACGSLWHLAIGEGSARLSLDPAASLAVSQCRAMRSTHLSLLDVDALPGLASCERDDLKADPEEEASFQAHLDALALRPPLLNLRELRVPVSLYGILFEDAETEAVNKQLIGAARTAGHLAVNASILRVFMSDPALAPELPAVLIQCMPSLEMVALSGHVETLSALMEVAPRLRELAGLVCCATSLSHGRKCQPCAAAVEAFKSQCPDVNVAVSAHRLVCAWNL